jgi:citrate lyase subunit beta/citryl-CoA lyase
VPASNPRMVEKARELDADEVFLDLEDAVAPAAKDDARTAAVTALRDARWRAGTVAVRVNALRTPWAEADVAAVVGTAGRLDCVIAPKVDDPDDVLHLDDLLARAETAAGREPGSVRLEVQIESARGLTNVDAVAAASARVEALVFGPVDFSADLGMAADDPITQDALLYPLMRILTAARAHGLQAIDGPYVKVRDVDGFRAAARRVSALGYDGKWVLHPDQVGPGNDAFTPTPEAYRRARALVAAYERATAADGDRRGAVMFGEEMIDEASRRLADAVVARGLAGGLEEDRA